MPLSRLSSHDSLLESAEPLTRVILGSQSSSFYRAQLSPDRFATCPRSPSTVHGPQNHLGHPRIVSNVPPPSILPQAASSWRTLHLDHLTMLQIIAQIPHSFPGATSSFLVAVDSFKNPLGNNCSPPASVISLLLSPAIAVDVSASVCL
jgi:hypothetical protein